MAVIAALLASVVVNRENFSSDMKVLCQIVERILSILSIVLIEGVIHMP